MAKIQNVEGAADGNVALRKALLDIDGRLSAMETSQSPTGSTAVKPPQVNAQMISVTGKDGKYIIEITPPAQYTPQTTQAKRNLIDDNAYDYDVTAATLYIKVQSSKTLEFDATGEVVTYGPSTQTHFEEQRPNEYRYFRFTMSYDQVNWAKWQAFIDPLVCGPSRIWSGLLRTQANVLLNSQATTTDGTNALSQDGTTTRILVASKTWNVGPEQITYNSGSVDPGSYGSFYVYAIDTDKSGGAVTFLTTQNIGDLTAHDGIIVFGFITTAGGGGGTGGGGGSCFVAGTQIEMYNGTFKNVESIVAGDEILGADGGQEIAQADAEAVLNVPCFTVAFDNGVATSQGVSSSEPLMLGNGTFVSVFRSVLGQQFQTRVDGSPVIAVLTTKTFIGNRTVYRLRLSHSKTYWADRIAAHNLKVEPF